jgi:hypothetical protein
MSTLSTEDRQKVMRGLMRWWSAFREQVVNLTKADLIAAVNATDTWIDDNQSVYNNALPTAARNNLTLEQKTFLFCAVACARVSIAFLRRVFGEVD